MRPVAEVIAHAAVEMQVHQTRHRVQTAHIDRLRRWLGGGYPVARNGQAARAERAVRLVYLQIFKLHTFPSFPLQQIPALGQRRFVRNHGYVGVELQDSRRHARRNRPKKRLAHDIRLILSGNDDHYAAREHDGLHAHGIRLTRHIVRGGEKALVCLDGGLGQVDAVRTLGKELIRLVKADMSVQAHAQQLQVDPPAARIAAS